MIKQAGKLFAEKNYVEAVDLYTQLSSNHPDVADYSYKYGVCLLYAGADKEEALKHLKIAAGKPGVDVLAYYYLGKAYQLNYSFKLAIEAYNNFKSRAPVKVLKEYDVTLLIKQCEEGKAVIQDIQSIHVLSKKEVSRADFYYAYDVAAIDRKVIVKSDEFKTKLDKKMNETSYIVHSPRVKEVYFSSYGEKGEAGKDIYKVVLFDDNTKSTPLNVGPNINTPFDEDYPYLHPNGRVLYFASKGHNSLGGYDIFRCELDTNTMLWGPAVNMGFAVNSPDDDILYVTDLSENVAYFSSSRASAKGEITVYKILPAKERVENTIIKGEILVEGNKQRNATITVTNIENGELVGVFKSNEKSGTYTMTLASNSKYKISVQAPGYAPHEETLALPSKKVAPIVNQKIQLKKTPAESMAVTNTMQSTVDEVAFNEIYRKGASLDVNTTKDVGFNSIPVVKKENKPTNNTNASANTNATSSANNASTNSNAPKEEKKEVTSSSMVSEAYDEALDLEKEYNKLKEEAEAADYVYRVKNDEANEAKQEIVDLTRQMNQTSNAEEKKKIQVEIDNKVKDLRRKAKEASITEHYAEQKKVEMKNKQEEAAAAKQYADVIKEAVETKNSDKAIIKLEEQRKKLEEIQERNSQSGEVSMEQSLAATKSNKEQEIKSTEVEIQKIDQAIKTIEADQKNLKKQIDATKNQQIKDELTLQLNETKEELAARQSDKMIAEAQLAAIKSETAETTETQVAADLQQKVNEVKKQDLAVLEAERKKQVAVGKSTNNATVNNASNTTVISSTNAVPNTKEDLSATLAKLDTVGKKSTPAEKYNDEMQKAAMTLDLVNSNKQEQTILEGALKSAKSDNAKAQAQKKIDELKVEEAKKNKEIENYIANANKIKEDSKLTPQQIASAPNKVDEKKVAAVQNYAQAVNTSSQSTANTASNQTAVVANSNSTANKQNTQSNTNSAQQSSTNTNVNANTAVNNNVNSNNQNAQNNSTAVNSNNAQLASKDTLKKKDNFPSKFNAENATKKEVEEAAMGAFGVKKQADAVVSSDMSVVTPLNNAKLAENAALNLMSQVEQKREIENSSTSIEEKKKLNKEIAELEKQAQGKELQASDNYFLANRAQYDLNQTIIKKAVNEGKLKTDQTVLTEIENNWLKALLIRDKIKNAKDFKEKISLINDANAKETEVLRKQQELINGITQNEVAVNNETKTNKVDTALKEVPVKEKTTETKVNEAFGVAPTEHEYSKDSQVQSALTAVNILEEDAAKNYEEAQTLKTQAAAAEKKSQAKKMNKEAVKKIKLGRAKMKQAMAKRAELNKTESDANKTKIQEAVAKKDLVLTEKQNKDLQTADEQFKKAEELRLKAKKTKSFAGQTDLNNQANAVETSALDMQRKVLEGKSDEAPKVVKMTPADSLKAKNVEAKDEVRNNQIALDQNQNRINVVQNENLTAQQKEEVIKLQKEVNNLIAQSKEKEIEASSTADLTVANATLNHADELKKQAIAKQQQILAIKENKPTAAAETTSTPLNTNKKTPEASKEYNTMLSDAQNMEKEIATEIEKYTQLKKEVKNYQLQSEQALANGKIDEADRLKKLANQKEEQALQSSQLIDNSRLEAKAKREEAKIYLQSLNAQVAKEVQSKVADKNAETDVYVNYKEKVEKDVTAANNNVSKQPVEQAKTNTVAVTKIDVSNSPLFGEKSNDVQGAVVKDQFEIKSDVVYSTAQPIPVDAPMPDGLIYTVQVGAFRNPIPQDLFKGISPLYGEKTPMGFIRYTAGTFRSFKAAAIAKDKIRLMGYPDAFVVPYYNGKRISMDQADQVTAKADVKQQNALQVIEAREVEAMNKVEVKNPVNNAVNAVQDNANKAVSSDVTTSDKVFYTVQIGVFSKEIKKGSIYDMQPLNVERTANGLLRYSVGKYDNIEAANKRKAEINAAGIGDAFVTAYKNGQRIAVADAQNTTNENTSSNANNTNTTNNSGNTANSVNIVFKVQVGAFAKEVPVETTTLFFNLPSKVEYYKDGNGITIFNVGNFTNIEDARKLKDQVIAAGLKDAFLVAYQGKEKISIEKAQELLKK